MVERLAKSLVTLRDQIDKLSPNRSKASDGWIGDAAHKSRKSDHNPWIRDGDDWVVSALDITNDPAHGVRAYALAKTILRDRRVKYIISEGKIASYDKEYVWRPYTGSNSHHHHVHISVRPEKGFYDDTTPWNLDAFKLTSIEANLPPTVEKRPTLRQGAKGEIVEFLQKLLTRNEFRVAVDGDFGPRTKEAVVAFQRRHQLTVDGIVGPQTWDRLEGLT